MLIRFMVLIINSSNLMRLFKFSALYIVICNAVMPQPKVREWRDSAKVQREHLSSTVLRCTVQQHLHNYRDCATVLIYFGPDTSFSIATETCIKYFQ